jgi:hypothetical protein
MATRQKKAATGRQTVMKPTKPNPFDDIARQVIADQEAKDREAGRNDLFPVPAKPVDRVKSKRTTTKPARRTKVQANGNGAAFSGRPTTKATAKQSAKPKGDFLAAVTLQQEWTDKKPDWLHRHVLIVRYQVRDDGAVFRTLTQIRTPDGRVLPSYKDYPLDFRPTQERDGRNRPVILKGDLKGPALRDWLLKRGIASPRGGPRHPRVPTIGASPRP